MVRIFCLLIILSGCASHKVVYGKEAEAPWGWKYTYCPSHKNEIGCENFQHIKSVYLFQHLQLKQQLANAEMCYTPVVGV